MPISDRRSKLPPATLLTTPAPFALSLSPAYLPPLPIDAATLKTIFIPRGFIHLHEALDLWGRSSQPDAWTTREIAARDLRAIASPAQWSGIERCAESAPQPGVITIPSATPRPYRVATTSGFRLVATESKAKQLWKSQRRKLKALFEQEQGARRRFEDARHALRQCLFATKLKAFVFEPARGFFAEIAPNHWGTENSNATFELRERPDQRPRPRLKPVPIRHKDRLLTIEGYALIREDELLALLSPPIAEPSRDESNTRNPGGRPKKFDEDAVIRELMQLANRPDGLPETKAELQRHLLEWCQTKFGEEPSLSTVKRWIDKWCPKARV